MLVMHFFLFLHLFQDDVLAAFDKVKDPENPRVMHDFVAEHFEGPGTEFIKWIPDDWTPK